MVLFFFERKTETERQIEYEFGWGRGVWEEMGEVKEYNKKVCINFFKKKIKVTKL